MKIVLFFLIAGVLFFLGMKYGSDWLSLYQEKQWSFVGDDNQTFQDTLVKELVAQQSLVVLEAVVQTTAVFDSTWFDLDIFKKVHRVIFTGRGLFIIDFSKVNRASLKIRDDEIFLSIGKPFLKDIIIDLEKTKFETDRGYLRFGNNVSLTTEQNAVLVQNAKESIRSKLSEQGYAREAREKSLESLKSLLGSIAEDKYQVTIDITGN